jgi:hypothetical protein
MQHILSDEEFDEYRRIRGEHQRLKQYKEDFVKKCNEYVKGNKVPCKQVRGEWYCDTCVIGELAPYERDADGRCPIGTYMEYSK